MVYTEFKTVEKPIIEWLQELDWKYIPSDELKRDIEEPFDLPTLQQAIKSLNPEIKTDGDVEKVINQLRRFLNDINGNKEFFEWLKGERSLVLKPGKKAKTIRLIDFENIENNIFVVTNQFKFSGYQNVRFDVVLMINGLPLVVMEAKAPTREMIDYHEAIKQISRYQRQAPQIFKYLAFTCATDGINFRYGVTEDRFFEWENPKFSDPLEASVKGLFDKRIFLDLIENFIIFEKEREEIRKKMAMYQQFRGANKIVMRVLEERDKKTGLLWHTQGSGKTLTMLFAAWKLKKIPELNNPTILLIVDRIDLQRQLWGTFANVDFPYTTKALSTKDLISKLKRESREVIITTMQKFEGIEEVLSKRENIFIFIDEAHRTQYGKLAIYMRNAFPNAMIFGFTGTPIDKGPLGKSTFRTFCPPGEKYLDKYSIKQSIHDGATVPLCYLPRLVDYHVPKETLDKEFFSLTTGLSDEEQEMVLEKSATLKTALKAKDRIEKIAQDIAEHFKTHIKPNGFKAQLVTVDREACALYKEALDKYLSSEHSVVIFTPNPNDDEFLRKYHMPKEEQLKIARITFQKPNENPRIIIVTDMLLTGFDAPIEQVMYLDKPLRDHKLLQAIARTNRPYPGKTVGIIVDYVGIFDNLVKALNFESEDIEGVAYDFNILKEEFTKTISELLEMFKGVKRKDTRESLFSVLESLKDEAKLKEFKGRFLKLRTLYETIAPDKFLIPYLKDYQWLIGVNTVYNKVFNRRIDLSEYEEKTKHLIKENLLIERIEREVPTFKIDENYLKNLEKKEYSPEEKIMEMRHALEYHIKINLEMNPIYETLSQRLERILKTKSKEKLLQNLEEMSKELLKIDEEAKKLGITKEEHALLSVIKKYAKEKEDKELLGFTKDLLKNVKADLFSGWHRKNRVVRNIQRKIFDACIQEFREALDSKTILAMTEEMTRFVIKYNP